MNKTFLLYGSAGWLFWHMLMVAIAPGDPPTPLDVVVTAVTVVAAAVAVEHICQRYPRTVEEDWEIEESEVWDE
jgi:hypothetical protein